MNYEVLDASEVLHSNLFTTDVMVSARSMHRFPTPKLLHYGHISKLFGEYY